MSIIEVLKTHNLAKIISYTSPGDACRLGLVSSVFRAAADSDLVWGRFLPPDYQEFICKSLLLTPSSLKLVLKKDIYFYLCDHPIVFDNDKTSIAIDKKTGKKCCMVGSGRLSILKGDNSNYWKWPSLPESRFTEVAQLVSTLRVEIEGRFETKNLSPETTYIAYLIFKFEQWGWVGFERDGIEFSVSVEKQEWKQNWNVNLIEQSQDGRREFDWKEIKMGEFKIEHEDDGEVICTVLRENPMTWKTVMRGLIIEGIEFRPKP